MRLGLGIAAALAGAVAWGQASAQEAALLKIPQQVDFTANAAELSRPDPDGPIRPGKRIRTGPPDDRLSSVRLGAAQLENAARRLGVRDGSAFRDQGRVYLFAAGDDTAVGYNLTRGEGGWERQGLSIDEGAFMGEAQAGVAWRKGDLQASFGYVRREIERRSRLGRSLDEDVVALQFSFTPGR